MEDYQVYITQARVLAAEENYTSAFDIYLMAFEGNRGLRLLYESEFRVVLFKLNNVFAELNKMDVIFSNIGRALSMFPNSTKLLNDIGKYLYKFGYYKEAMKHFEKALEITPMFVEVEKNLNSVKNLLVERWHYRMLNDNIRNESYRQAIHQSMTLDEDRVLDVGTGTGLLAIYAHEAKPSSIIGCDGSEVMCNLADKIVHRNNIRNIKVINKMSTDLTLWDLGGRCTVLLTEMFDAGLFGEHVLQMLSHAWSSLLTDKATVVPNSAEFFVEGVQCDHLSKNYQLCSEIKSLLEIPTLNVHVHTDNETYDCEDVHLIKNVQYLTGPQSVLKINFNDLKDIEETLERTEPYELELEAKEDGQINVIIGWFNLYLTDTITVTTNPNAPDRANAWQQAVFFDDIPKTVQKNESVTLKFLVNGGKLTMVPSSNSPIVRASAEIIKFLNDLEYMKMITECLSMACIYLGQFMEMSEIAVVDLSPFPLFGLLMLKRGAKSLLCSASNECDKDFILRVCSENKISVSNLTIFYGDNWTPDIFRGKYHAIFTHILELDGEVNPRLKWTAERLKTAHLHERGLFMPTYVNLVAQLVSCHWLDLNNRLFDVNVSKFQMADYVNKFTVTQNFRTDFSVLKYVPIADPVVVSNLFDTLYGNDEKTVQVMTDGYANAILCWYDIQLMHDLREISTNRPNSFIGGMLFLTYSKEQLYAGKYAKIIPHYDYDSSFKLVMQPNDHVLMEEPF